MKKCFLVLVSLVVFVSMLLSFVAAAETSEPESNFTEQTTEAAPAPVTESVSSEPSEAVTTSSAFNDQSTIINRLDMIYTLGLFIVGIFAALLVVFILWRVLDVFL